MGFRWSERPHSWLTTRVDENGLQAQHEKSPCGSRAAKSAQRIIEFFFLLACPNPKLINKTKYPWNDHDQEVQATCIRRCPELYKDAPCLKTFVKYDKQDYDCICGATSPSKE